MSQVTDRTVGANPSGFDMRTELNNIIAALESDNSGSSEPLNPVPYMKWLDTSNATYYYYKERNHDNTAWNTLIRYKVADKTMDFMLSGNALSDLLAAKIARVGATDNCIMRADGTNGDLQQSTAYINDTGYLAIGTTTFNSRLNIGGSYNPAFAGTTAQFVSTNQAVGGAGIISVSSSDSTAANMGGSIGLNAYDSSLSSSYPCAVIAGRRISGTAGNTEGYFQIGVCNSSQTIVERFRVTSNGDVLAKGGAVGNGSGATVTQATNKATSVTINATTGRVTTNNAALAAGASIEFTVINSTITDTDIVYPVVYGNVNYEVKCRWVLNGQCLFKLTNVTAGSLSEAVDINFIVFKGALA